MIKEKIDLILLCVSGVISAVTTLLIVFVLCTCTCFGAEKQNTTKVKKTVSQSTSRENAIRREMYNQYVKQTGSRSRAYYLYY